MLTRRPRELDCVATLCELLGGKMILLLNHAQLSYTYLLSYFNHTVYITTGVGNEIMGTGHKACYANTLTLLPHCMNFLVAR